MLDFGNKLKKLRLNHNMTQMQLAVKLGLTKSVISAYEKSIRLPSYNILISISNIFNVSTDYLLGLENRNHINFFELSEEEVTALVELVRVIKKEA